MNENIVSVWLPVPDAEHCYMRIISGTDETLIENRVAFIEKTPRVRIGAFTDINSDWKNWEQGPKGCGPDYGEDTTSREWCDNRLRELGYVVPESSLVREDLLIQEDAVLTALKNMVSMWRTVCSCHGWDPDHLVEYGEALKEIKKVEDAWQLLPK